MDKYKDYVDENTHYDPVYDGPGHHCDDCKREYNFSCIGPRKYGDLWLCTDCKRERLNEDFDLRFDQWQDEVNGAN